MDALIGCSAEAIGKIEESLGDATGDIGENQVRQRFIRAAQTLSQCTKHVLCKSRVCFDDFHQVGVLQMEECCGRNSGCGG